MKNRFFTLLVLLCVFIITLSACNKDNKTTATRKYGFQPPIEKLCWGMSLDQIESILGIENGVKGVEYKYDKPFTTITLKKRIKKFGYEATVSLEVCDEPDQEWYPFQSSYLTYVKLTYNNIEGKKVRDSISKAYASSGEDWVDAVGNTCTTWLSKDHINDIEPSLKKELDSLWALIAEHTSQPENRTKPFKNENDNINYISIVYSSQGAVVTFAGDTSVSINQIITKR
jgi:hypothetical protein